MFESLCCFVSLVGIYALCCYLYDNLKSPILLLICKYKEKNGTSTAKPLKERYGSWAAITGATDGIGKAYAKELAAQGLNIVLISRTLSKLEAVAAELEQKFKVQTKVIVADFTKGEEVYLNIENQLGDLPIGILINNVGCNTPQHGELATFSAKEIWNVIYTNIGAVTQMSRLFIRRMYEAHIKGIVVNISSGSESQPAPFSAIYAASKVFNKSLTLALQEEARPYNIEVQLVSPHFVVTKINAYSKTVMRGGLLIPNADTYARWAVSTIGKTNVTTGYFWHGIEEAVSKLLPYRFRAAWVSKLLKGLVSEDIRMLRNEVK